MLRTRLAVLFATVLCVLLASCAFSETLAELKANMDKVAVGFHGTLGYSLHLRGKHDERISLNADEQYPTASTIKTAIMCEVMHQIEQGKIKWNDQLEVQPEWDREEGGFAFYFKDGTKIPIGQWVHLMITMSDNTATIRLRDCIGQKNVNDWLTSHGFKQTLLLNGKQCDDLGLRPLQHRWGLGVTTPNEMLRLIEMIRDGKAGSPASCDRMMRLLNHQYWDDYTAGQVSPYVHCATKTGAIDHARSDVSIFTTPKGEVALTIYTKNQQDDSWEKTNEGDMAIRKLAQMVWRHYDPDHTWAPPTGETDLLPSE